MSPQAKRPGSPARAGTGGRPQLGRRRSIPRTAAALLLLLALGPARSSVAADADPADLLIAQGVELRRRGENASALDLFRQAFERTRSPRARAQIALAEQALGQWVEAERDLEAALGDVEDPWIRKNRSSLAGAGEVIRRHLASLDVTTNEVGAQLSINGTRTSTLPLARPIRVVAGELLLEVEKPGFESLRRSITVVADMTARESMPLVRSRPLATTTSTASAGDAPPLAQVSRAEPSGSDPSGWVVLGGGVLLAAAGFVGHVVYETNAAVWNDDARCVTGTATREQTCGDYGRRADTAQIVAIAGYGLGAAAAIVGATLLLTTPSRPSHGVELASPGVICAPDPTRGLGAVCLVSF